MRLIMAAKKRAKAPRFTNMHPATEASSRTKRASSAHSGTKPELMLQIALKSRGLSFRENAHDLPGKPDMVFDQARVVVFCDGDFWHGRDWRRLRAKLEEGANAAYWIAKIKTNRARDRRHTVKLIKLGWQVLRFWEKDIRSETDRIAAMIADQVKDRSQLNNQDLLGGNI
jgi:DNA mismatch endonuclease, patch repair protein